MKHEESDPHKWRKPHEDPPSKTIIAIQEPSNSYLDKDSIDPYKVLSLRRDATFAEIMSSYHRLAILKHPRRQRSLYSDPCNSSNKEWDFLVLSACYEILKTHRYRRAYDDLYRRQERKHQRLLQSRQHEEARRKHKSSFNQYDLSINPIHRTSMTCLPNIFRPKDGDSDETTSTTSAPSTRCDVGAFLKLSFDSEDELLYRSSTIENSFSYEDEEEFPRTSADMDDSSDMYKGPLGLLYRARNYENFSDPYEVFRTEFGSDVFSFHSTTTGDDDQEAKFCTTSSPYRKERSLSVQGSSADSLIKHDSWNDDDDDDDDDVASITHGNVSITKTSRIIDKSKITRIETIKTDPKTGKKQKIVEVLREDIEDEENSIDSDERDSSPVADSNLILSCLAGNHSNPTSPVSCKDHDKDKLTLKKLLFSCGRFIP